MTLLLLKLIIAHFIGDFLLQPDSWIKDKLDKKLRSRKFYFHLLIHAFALIFFLEFDFSYWLAILLIICTHGTIDWIKVSIQNGKNQKVLFFLDQLAHIVVILFVVRIYYSFQLDTDILFERQALMIVSSFLFVTVVSSVIIKMVIVNWQNTEMIRSTSLKNAGAYIGMLERSFVLLFIILNYWSGIGFLLAAKSVFRFGDLTNEKDRALTEYILIGTLLSFGLAIITGLVYTYVLK